MQEENRKGSGKFQRNKESCQQSKRNVRLCEPEMRDVDSYLAFDKNCDKFVNQLGKLGLYLHDIPGDGNCFEHWVISWKDIRRTILSIDAML